MLGLYECLESMARDLDEIRSMTDVTTSKVKIFGRLIGTRALQTKTQTQCWELSSDGYPVLERFYTGSLTYYGSFGSVHNCSVFEMVSSPIFETNCISIS
jgi:hypothetical protein